MTALSYRARRNQVDLRLVVYKPAHEPVPEGHMKVVVQVVERGRPIAEDPIHTETMPELDLARAIHISRFDGWDIQPWERSH